MQHTNRKQIIDDIRQEAHRRAHSSEVATTVATTLNKINQGLTKDYKRLTKVNQKGYPGATSSAPNQDQPSPNFVPSGGRAIARNTGDQAEGLNQEKPINLIVDQELSTAPYIHCPDLPAGWSSIKLDISQKLDERSQRTSYGLRAAIRTSDHQTKPIYASFNQAKPNQNIKNYHYRRASDNITSTPELEEHIQLVQQLYQLVQSQSQGQVYVNRGLIVESGAGGRVMRKIMPGLGFILDVDFTQPDRYTAYVIRQNQIFTCPVWNQPSAQARKHDFVATQLLVRQVFSRYVCVSLEEYGI